MFLLISWHYFIVMSGVSKGKAIEITAAEIFISNRVLKRF